MGLPPPPHLISSHIYYYHQCNEQSDEYGEPVRWCSGQCPSMRCVRRRKTLCRRKLPTANESFKLARAGGPSQELALPVESYGTLSQSQAEDIVKAAASRFAKRAIRQEGASEIPRGKQMKVEKVRVTRKVLPSNRSAQQLDTIGMQVDELRTVREVMKMSGQELDSALGGASKLVNSFGELFTAAVTADNGVAASLENPIVPWSYRVASFQKGSMRLR